MLLCYTCQVLTSSSLPVYHKIFVNTSGSQSQRVTFDACEGSNEHHYWDHHAGSTEPHTTGLCIRCNSNNSVSVICVIHSQELAATVYIL